MVGQLFPCSTSPASFFSIPLLQKDLNNRMRQLLFARHACERVEAMLGMVVARGATEEELNCINLLRTWMLTFTETPVAARHWRDTCARVAAILAGSQGLEELIKEYCHICESDILCCGMVLWVLFAYCRAFRAFPLTASCTGGEHVDPGRSVDVRDVLARPLRVAVLPQPAALRHAALLHVPDVPHSRAPRLW